MQTSAGCQSQTTYIYLHIMHTQGPTGSKYIRWYLYIDLYGRKCVNTHRYINKCTYIHTCTCIIVIHTQLKYIHVHVFTHACINIYIN